MYDVVTTTIDEQAYVSRTKRVLVPEILGAYEAVYRWVKENRREPSEPAREIYLSGPGGDEQLQIAAPLR